MLASLVPFGMWLSFSVRHSTLSQKMKSYRCELSFGSVVKLFSLVGLGFGVIAVPVLVAVAYLDPPSSDDEPDLLFLVFGGFISAALNGAALGAVGYPGYRLFCRLRRPPLLSGFFEPEAALENEASSGWKQ